MYETLTADNDLVGMFAYIIYKRNKIEFCTSFHGDRPASEVLEQFHAIASFDTPWMHIARWEKPWLGSFSMMD